LQNEKNSRSDRQTSITKSQRFVEEIKKHMFEQTDVREYGNVVRQKNNLPAAVTATHSAHQFDRSYRKLTESNQNGSFNLPEAVEASFATQCREVPKDFSLCFEEQQLRISLEAGESQTELLLQLGSDRGQLSLVSEGEHERHWSQDGRRL